MASAKRTDRNFASDPGFDEDTMRDFEERLARVRPGSRPGYLRGKGRQLIRLDDPIAVRVGIFLLERVVVDWPEPVHLGMGQHLNVPWAHELLGEAYTRLSDLARAEEHFRLCLAKVDPNRNGTSGVTELFLAEVLLRKGDRASIAESAGLLEQPQLKRRLLWNTHNYRYCVAHARLAKFQGRDPSAWAKRALELAADTRPQTPHHPTVGLVSADEATVAELKQLVGAFKN